MCNLSDFHQNFIIQKVNCFATDFCVSGVNLFGSDNAADFLVFSFHDCIDFNGKTDNDE